MQYWFLWIDEQSTNWKQGYVSKWQMSVYTDCPQTLLCLQNLKASLGRKQIALIEIKFPFSGEMTLKNICSFTKRWRQSMYLVCSFVDWDYYLLYTVGNWICYPGIRLIRLFWRYWLGSHQFFCSGWKPTNNQITLITCRAGEKQVKGKNVWRTPRLKQVKKMTL